MINAVGKTKVLSYVLQVSIIWFNIQVDQVCMILFIYAAV